MSVVIKMLKVTVLFLALVCVSFAALAVGPLEEKPKKFENQEGCYIKELDEMISFGSSKPSKTSCMEYRCRKTYVQYATCGVEVALPPCYTVENKTKPYPDCCKTIVCPEQR